MANKRQSKWQKDIDRRFRIVYTRDTKSKKEARKREGKQDSTMDGIFR